MERDRDRERMKIFLHKNSLCEIFVDESNVNNGMHVHVQVLWCTYYSSTTTGAFMYMYVHVHVTCET